MANPSIFAQYSQPVRSVQEYGNDIERGRFLRQQTEMQRAAMDQSAQQQQMAAQQQQQIAARQNALMQIATESGGDPERMVPALYRGGFTAEAQKLEEHRANVRDKGSQAGERDIKTENAVIGAYRDLVTQVTNPEQAAQLLEAMRSDHRLVNSPIARFQVDKAVAQLAQNPGALESWKQQMALGASEYIKQNKPNYVTRDLGGNVQTMALPGLGGDPSVVSSSVKTMAPGESARLAEDRRQFGVTDQRARERLTFDKETAAQKAATAGAGSSKPLTEQQTIKRRDQIAKDHKAAATTLANMDDLVTSANEVLTAPGLNRATGLYAYAPSWPDGGAARAEVKLKNLEGKVTQLGKAAAALAGAIGPMAVQEWKIVRDMIAAIEPKKGEEALREQIRLVESTAQGAAQRIREGYEKQYGPDFERFPEFQELPEPKQKAAPAGASRGDLVYDHATRTFK